jgi:hypothetical protein
MHFQTSYLIQLKKSHELGNPPRHTIVTPLKYTHNLNPRKPIFRRCKCQSQDPKCLKKEVAIHQTSALQHVYSASSSPEVISGWFIIDTNAMAMHAIQAHRHRDFSNLRICSGKQKSDTAEPKIKVGGGCTEAAN